MHFSFRNNTVWSLSKNPFLGAVSSGLLFTLAYNFPSVLWWLCLFGLYPLLFSMEKNSKLPRKKLFFLGLIFGFTFIGGVLLWYFFSYPLTWIHIPHPLLNFFLIFTVWSVSSLFLGSFFGLWVVFYQKFRTPSWRNIVFGASLWVLLDYTRAFGYSLILAGKESLLGPHLTFGFIGYPLVWSHILSPLASWGGVYFMSFIALCINILFFSLFQKKLSYKKMLVIGIMLFICLGEYFASFILSHIIPSIKNRIPIAVVTTNFERIHEWPDQENKIRILEQLMKTLSQEKKPFDMVILPEDSSFLYSLQQRNFMEEYMQTLFPQKELLFIDSARVQKEHTIQSILFSYSTLTKNSTETAKYFLLPQGEYLPNIVKFFAFFTGQREWLGIFNHTRGYTRGTELQTIPFKEERIGSLLCSEIHSPLFYRTLTTENKATVLVNLASHGVFHGSLFLYNQTLSLAKMRAIENNRYFIQAGDHIPAFVVDNHGQIVAQAEKDKDSILLGEVVSISKVSLYDRLGDWILTVSCAIISLQLLLWFKYKK